MCLCIVIEKWYLQLFISTAITNYLGFAQQITAKLKRA